MDLERVQPGQKFRPAARDWNTFIDAAKFFKRNRFAAGVGALPAPQRDGGILYVRNDSGAARDRFDVLGISGVLFDADANQAGFDNQPALKGITPAIADHEGQFVVLLAPAAEDAIVPCLLDGWTRARVNIQTAGDGFAEVTDGDASQLTSNPAGSARILFAPDGTGTQECLVRLADPADNLIGKADSEIAARSGTTPGSGTVSLWTLDPESGTPLSDSGVDVVAYNLATDAVGTDFIQLKRVGRFYWVDWEQC